jgi:hypothetical protein
MSFTLDRHAPVAHGKVFLTDAEICERWRCTEMTLWRKLKMANRPKRPH